MSRHGTSFLNCSTIVLKRGVCHRVGNMALLVQYLNTPPKIHVYLRGITLTSSVYKVFCAILNERLTRWVEQNDLLQDNHNGFRHGSSCVDNLSSLSMIAEHENNKSTYSAFIWPPWR